MRHALELARRGRGDVEPNPMVGCVIVSGGQIIAQGHHAIFGGPHAEAAALAACTASPRGATAYVTLEPCCHTGKKNPPCVPLLIAANLARIVVACEDPNPRVAGSGIRQLRDAGLSVDVGVADKEARQLNAAFFARQLFARPYVTLKWAQTADGKIAGPGGKPVKISCAASFKVIHALRAKSDAILVGIGTALSDNPLLTPRPPHPRRRPLRIVIDRENQLPPDSRLAKSSAEFPLHVYNRDNTPLDSAGHLCLPAILSDLHQRGVTHLLVEPGPRLAAGFLRQNLADRLWLFRAPNRMNDDTAPAAITVPFPPIAATEIDGDLLTEHLNPQSDVFYASCASADFLATEVLATDGAKNFTE